MTIWEAKGKLEGLKMAFVGDGNNNVTHSLCLVAAMLKMDFSCGAPKGFWMNKKIVKQTEVNDKWSVAAIFIILIILLWWLLN